MAPSATTAAATATAVAAAVVPTAELVASDHLQQKRWNPIHFTNQNIPAFLRTPYQTAAPPKTFEQKKKKAKEVTSVGGTTAIARTLMMQGLFLFYRTPLFRPLRVDYLIMARALMPMDDASSKRFSFRYTSIGMITHAVKTKGASYPSQSKQPFPPPPYSSVFMAGSVFDLLNVALILMYIVTGCLAGAAQSVIATPLDSLKVRFEVSDLLEGKHTSMYQFAKSTLKELGIASAYRGFTLTLIRDSLACGLFFATFEWMKQQGYYYFLDEMYGVQVDSENTLNEIEKGWNEVHKMSDEDQHQIICASGKKAERPPLMLEPLFVILAGATAAVAYQTIEHPLSKIHSIFYIEEGQSEFTNKSSREPVNRLYRRTWEQCKTQVKLNGGSWRRFLYQEFAGTVIRVVPATSVGFLVFELVKREVDFRSIDFDSL
ncbi:mitochondrial carrier protein [Mucor ambiguus]|uniref:Mitochondrial carrier protein n=1 Tax=Mucor ambiguus TaxID=91626 RepID=A0A0C9MSY6_9FUNG|nr:mitochondrial carrier protein [Mucor ambiguus]